MRKVAHEGFVSTVLASLRCYGQVSVLGFSPPVLLQTLCSCPVMVPTACGMSPTS